jgi:diaminopimelate epimerase
MGNPHAVAFVESLAVDGPIGTLATSPVFDEQVYPHGVNVELVVPVGPGHVAMRVHERGSGETRSCGTGACAVAVAAAVRDGAGPGATYTVDLPGGTLTIEWTAAGRVLMTGPAVVVARGETDL